MTGSASLDFRRVVLMTVAQEEKRNPQRLAGRASVTGLHFVGEVAAEEFGPVIRFVYGNGLHLTTAHQAYLARPEASSSAGSGLLVSDDGRHARTATGRVVDLS